MPRNFWSLLTDLEVPNFITIIESREIVYNHLGTYTEAIPAGDFYKSWNGYNDELVWGAAWVAKASGEQADIDKAEALWKELGGAYSNPSEVSWDDKWAMTFLMMFDITGKVREKFGWDLLIIIYNRLNFCIPLYICRISTERNQMIF